MEKEYWALRASVYTWCLMSIVTDADPPILGAVKKGEAQVRNHALRNWAWHFY